VQLLAAATAAWAFQDAWGPVFAAAHADVGLTITCLEADTAADLFRVFGDDDTADGLLDGHAVHDTEVDRHYQRGDQARRAVRHVAELAPGQEAARNGRSSGLR
jgi:hypothetical protein